MPAPVVVEAKGIGSLGAGVQMVVNHLIWELGIELGFSLEHCVL